MLMRRGLALVFPVINGEFKKKKKNLSSCEVGIVCPAVERGAKSFLLIAAEMAPGNVEEMGNDGH